MICYLFDIDGTFIHNTDYCSIRDEVPQQMIDVAKRIKAKGHCLFLFTARSPGNWVESFRRQGLEFVDVVYKPVANHYIVVDDRLLTSFNTLQDFIDYDKRYWGS